VYNITFKYFLIFLCTALSLVCTFNYVKNNEKADLWCTTIGSRIIVEKKQSPYYFKWNWNTDKRYVDPTDDNMHPVSRVTFTPFFAIIFYVFAWIDMEVLKWVCYVFTWIVLLFIYLKEGFFDLNKTNNVLFFSIFIINATAWWIHCSEGQKYILFLLLLYGIYKAILKPDYTILSIFLGVLVLIRPNSILSVAFLFFIFGFKHFRKQVVGLFLVAVLFLLSTAIADKTIWSDYFSAMHLYSIYGLGEMPVLDEYFKNPIGLNVKATEFPFDYSLRHNNSGVQRWFYKILGWKLYKEQLFALYSFIALSVIIVCKKLKLNFDKPENLFLVFFFLYITSEYFIPASRLPYYYVQWFFPIILMLKSYQKMNKLIQGLFWVGLSLNTIFLSFIPFGQIIGELCILFCLLYLILKESMFFELVLKIVKNPNNTQ